jgi:hypothetical protein
MHRRGLPPRRRLLYAAYSKRLSIRFRLWGMVFPITLSCGERFFRYGVNPFGPRIGSENREGRCQMEWLSLIPLGGMAALAMVYLKHREINLKEREIRIKERECLPPPIIPEVEMFRQYTSEDRVSVFACVSLPQEERQRWRIWEVSINRPQRAWIYPIEYKNPHQRNLGVKVQSQPCKSIICHDIDLSSPIFVLAPHSLEAVSLTVTIVHRADEDLRQTAKVAARVQDGIRAVGATQFA